MPLCSDVRAASVLSCGYLPPCASPVKCMQFIHMGLYIYVGHSEKAIGG